VPAKAAVELALYLIRLATVGKDKLFQKEWLKHAPEGFMVAWCNAALGKSVVPPVFFQLAVRT